MKISIQPIGKFFSTDQNGFILNPTSRDLIPKHWLTVLDQIFASYEQHLGDELHSIYLRGSLPRGMAIDGWSDIDTFALIKRPNIRWQNAPWEKDIEQALRTKYSFVKELEMMLSSHCEKPADYARSMQMLIKTQSLLLKGEDVSAQMPNFRPGKDMMLNYKWLATDINIFLTKEEIALKDCQNIMKVFLRVGFELVMERLQRFTTDLYLSYKSFSDYYPEKEEIMRECLELYLNPIQSKKLLNPIVFSFGNWLIKEVEQKILMHH